MNLVTILYREFCQIPNPITLQNPTESAQTGHFEPDYFSYPPQAHRCLQQRLNRISLLPC